MLHIILISALAAVQAGSVLSRVQKPAWQADVGQTKVSVYQIQVEDPNPGSAYDWGPCVMKDGPLYRMWWTRPNAPTEKTVRYESTDDEGKPFVYESSTATTFSTPRAATATRGISTAPATRSPSISMAPTRRTRSWCWGPRRASGRSSSSPTRRW